MADKKLDSPVLIDDRAGLRRMVEQMRDKRVIALDTESDSLFSYFPKVCLIQISVYQDGEPEGDDRGEVADFLVDPLALDSMDPLGELISQPEREIVMHAADNDLLLLQREFGISIERLFDTQLAARILGKDKVGLAAILDEEFGVVSNKRMQRTNWGIRPLKEEQIVYAQKDTHYLLPLRNKLISELKSAGRWDEAQEAFGQLAETDFDGKEPSERTMWQMKETRTLPRESLGVLEALWDWREGEAQRRDTPPFKVLRNQALVEMAEQQPSTLDEIAHTPGVGEGGVRRYGAALLDTIREGRVRPIPDLPEPSNRPEYMLDKKVLARFDRLRKWRTASAEKRGVAPEIVMSNATLLEVAKRRPSNVDELQEIREIGPWKANTYGTEILAIVKK